VRGRGVLRDGRDGGAPGRGLVISCRARGETRRRLRGLRGGDVGGSGSAGLGGRGVAMRLCVGLDSVFCGGCERAEGLQDVAGC
jgi:hypothetical protein